MEMEDSKIGRKEWIRRTVRANRKEATNIEYEKKWQELESYLHELEIDIKDVIEDDIIDFLWYKKKQIGRAFDTQAYMNPFQVME
jgi:hypothetical protein